MRKIIIWIMTSCLTLILATGAMAAGNDIKYPDVDINQLNNPAAGQPTHQAVFVIGESKYTSDNVIYTMDAATYTENGRTLVPVRYLAYALGVSAENVKWDSTTNNATLELAGTKLALKLNSKQLDKNGQKSQMDVAPVQKNNRIYLPARFVAEALGYEVSYDSYSNAVLVGPPGKLPNPPALEPIGDGKPAGKVETGRDLGGGTDMSKPDNTIEDWNWVN